MHEPNINRQTDYTTNTNVTVERNGFHITQCALCSAVLRVVSTLMCVKASKLWTRDSYGATCCVYVVYRFCLLVFCSTVSYRTR